MSSTRATFFLPLAGVHPSLISQPSIKLLRARHELSFFFTWVMFISQPSANQPSVSQQPIIGQPLAQHPSTIRQPTAKLLWVRRKRPLFYAWRTYISQQSSVNHQNYCGADASRLFRGLRLIISSSVTKNQLLLKLLRVRHEPFLFCTWLAFISQPSINYYGPDTGRQLFWAYVTLISQPYVKYSFTAESTRADFFEGFW